MLIPFVAHFRMNSEINSKYIDGMIAARLSNATRLRSIDSFHSDGLY